MYFIVVWADIGFKIDFEIVFETDWRWIEAREREGEGCSQRKGLELKLNKFTSLEAMLVQSYDFNDQLDYSQGWSVEWIVAKNWELTISICGIGALGAFL